MIKWKSEKEEEDKEERNTLEEEEEEEQRKKWRIENEDVRACFTASKSNAS